MKKTVVTAAGLTLSAIGALTILSMRDLARSMRNRR